MARKRVRCPYWFCWSKDVVPVTTDKAFKTGKGLIGGAIGAAALGPIGAVAGVATGFNGKKKVKFRCNKCGRIFKAKV